MKRLAWAVFGVAVAAAQTNVVSVKVGDETVPAGGMAQVKVYVTEPKPIIRGSFDGGFETDFFSDFEGTSVLSSAGDTCGALYVSGGVFKLDMFGYSATLGNTPDYPLLTIAVPVRAGTPVGRQSPVTISNPVWIYNGVYAEESKPGRVTVGSGVLNVWNILPGGGTIPAGQAVEVVGSGLDNRSRVRVEGAEIDRVEFVSSTLLRVRFGGPVTLDGARFVVTNNGGETVTYYSYLRPTHVLRTQDTRLQKVHPLYARTAVTRALLLAGDVRSTPTRGIAIRNPNAQPVSVTLTFISSVGSHWGSAAGKTVINLPGYSDTVRGIEESGGPAETFAVLLESTGPVNALRVGLGFGDSPRVETSPAFGLN